MEFKLTIKKKKEKIILPPQNIMDEPRRHDVEWINSGRFWEREECAAHINWKGEEITFLGVGNVLYFDPSSSYMDAIMYKISWKSVPKTDALYYMILHLNKKSLRGSSLPSLSLNDPPMDTIPKTDPCCR